MVNAHAITEPNLGQGLLMVGCSKWQAVGLMKKLWLSSVSGDRRTFKESSMVLPETELFVSAYPASCGRSTSRKLGNSVDLRLKT